MGILRRILGVFVMIAGVIGLLLSLAGLAGIWAVTPTLKASVSSVIDTLLTSIDTSQKTVGLTADALDATINSVDALSDMLGTTALTVEDTRPVITQLNTLMGETLPGALDAATGSLTAAQEAAVSLEGAIQSFETFQSVLSVIPFISGFVPSSTSTYSPEPSLAESLGELSLSLEDMPAQFEEMAAGVDKADDNLVLIQDNLVTISENVALISDSLGEYQSMIASSNDSMDDLKTMLTDLQSDMGRFINIAAAVLTLFFLWLLAAQVVIFSQGFELFHGTAGRMDAGTTPVPAASPEPVIAEEYALPSRDAEQESVEEGATAEAETPAAEETTQDQ